jgi:acetylcholinesterase
VPVLVDNDSDEGSIFAPNAATPAEVQIFFQNQYPNLTADQLNAIIEMYPLMQPLPEHEAWFPSASAAYGEACFIFPGNEIASAVAKYLSPNLAWVARYNVQDPAQIAAGLGVSHTIDLAAIFGCGDAIACPASYTTINAPIVPITMHYYISFIIALNPNTFKLPEAPAWESWGPSTGSRLRIQTDDTAMEDVPGDQIARCSAWKLFSASMEV